MNYQRIYNQIIERARLRQISGYTEKHHIIPRCMGGDDNKPNLVRLTAREHYIVHQLLVEIYPSEIKLKWALYLMTIGKRKHKDANYCISSRVYERLKIEGTKMISISLKGRTISEDHINAMRNANLGLKRSEETKQRMRKPKRNTDKMKRPKSEETKQKISKKLKGRTFKLSDESLVSRRKYYKQAKERNNKISLANSVIVIQCDLQDNFIKEWDNITQANLSLGKEYNASSIPLCCKGIYKTAFGFKWKYKEKKI